MSPDLETQMNQVVARRLQNAPAAKRIGFQTEYQTRHLTATVTNALGTIDWVAADPLLNDLQKRKDLDEIELIRQSIRADLAAYTAARNAIGPGVNELEVLAAAQQAAYLEAGEKIFHDGDYSCNAMGGFARNRECQAGELYVIDAWSIYRGYWADLCRTFAVTEPTDIQQSIFDHVKAFHQLVLDYLRPGRNGTELFTAMDAHIRQHPALTDIGLVHHAGHNVGLRAHQMPDLNKDRGGTLEVGNVVSVEPGAYIDEAQAGVRLENMYLITEQGVENLSDYPMELT
jgi:Xaa-Pro aminopeptidase